MLGDVVALVNGRVQAFELGVVCEVFGVDRTDDGLPCFDFAVCGVDLEPIPAAGGMTIRPQYRLDRAASADLLVIPAWSEPLGDPPEPLLDALRAGVDRGARVLGVCSGAFALAASGLLNGRRATCHWKYAKSLAERFPLIDVDYDKLYVVDGPMITSAGTAAGIDACLHLVRTEYGAKVANGIARRMVVPPHRDGGQAQYVDTPVPQLHAIADDLGCALAWAQSHLHEDITVARLAMRTHMSTRTFARRFVARTGTTPHQWITRQRVILAQRLLEEDTLDVDQVASRCGFGSSDLLRHHFAKSIGISPSSYRRKFQHEAS